MNLKPRLIKLCIGALLASLLLSPSVIAQSLAGISDSKSSCGSLADQSFLDRFEYPALSYQSISETADMVANSEPLLDGRFLIAMQVSELVREKLSQPSLDYFNIIIDRAVQSGVTPAEANKTIDLLVGKEEETAWESLNSEVRVMIDDHHEKPIPAAIIWGIILCDLNINACINDAEQAWEDCVSGAICNGEEFPNGPCCDSRYSDDLLNCAVTCGTNGPDGDYALCCGSGPQAPPSGGG